MSAEVIEVEIKDVLPVHNGCAIFLGPPEKTFVIYVDQYIGLAITAARSGEKRQRPLTHDLIASILLGLEAQLDRVLISRVDEGIFYAHILLRMENELGRKIIDIDARPSDSIVLALQLQRPVYVSRAVLDNVEDMTEILARIRAQQKEQE